MRRKATAVMAVVVLVSSLSVPAWAEEAATPVPAQSIGAPAPASAEPTARVFISAPVGHVGISVGLELAGRRRHCSTSVSTKYRVDRDRFLTLLRNLTYVKRS